MEGDKNEMKTREKQRLSVKNNKQIPEKGDCEWWM